MTRGWETWCYRSDSYGLGVKVYVGGPWSWPCGRTYFISFRILCWKIGGGLIVRVSNRPRRRRQDRVG